ncbi:MAG: hypothetical protein JHD16_02840 [Solirubrobacteraceae bacterium]|nr:hypothetical protein [Solirubrobacteraceae bacterium]
MSFASPQLRLDWASHHIDELAAGLAIVTIPFSGGCPTSWTRLVENVQRLSAVAAHGPHWLQLVGARAHAQRPALEIGIRGTGTPGAYLEAHLRTAVADANAWSTPDVRRSVALDSRSGTMVAPAFAQRSSL